MRVEHVADDLAAQLRRAPTPDEIAGQIGVGVEKVLEARTASGAYRPISVDRPREDDDGDDMVETIGAEDPGYHLTDDAATLDALMSILDEREREVLRLRFRRRPHTGRDRRPRRVSQMHVSRLIRDSVDRLREAANLDAASAA